MVFLLNLDWVKKSLIELQFGMNIISNFVNIFLPAWLLEQFSYHLSLKLPRNVDDLVKLPFALHDWQKKEFGFDLIFDFNLIFKYFLRIFIFIHNLWKKKQEEKTLNL